MRKKEHDKIANVDRRHIPALQSGLAIILEYNSGRVKDENEQPLPPLFLTPGRVRQTPLPMLPYEQPTRVLMTTMIKLQIHVCPVWLTESSP